MKPPPGRGVDILVVVAALIVAALGAWLVISVYRVFFTPFLDDGSRVVAPPVRTTGPAVPGRPHATTTPAGGWQAT